MADSKLDTIKQLATEFLQKLSVNAPVTVVEDVENTFKVQIETEEGGLLIGYHGETLNSLQLLLGSMVYKQLGEWMHIVVHVGDYREKREESIKALALRVAQEVVETKLPVPMPYLSSFERRIVHLTLADHPDVVSESEGEGRDRRVVVKPKVDNNISH